MFLLVKELVKGECVTREVFINTNFVRGITSSKDGKYFEVEFTVGASPMTIEATRGSIEDNLEALRVR